MLFQTSRYARTSSRKPVNLQQRKFDHQMHKQYQREAGKANLPRHAHAHVIQAERKPFNLRPPSFLGQHVPRSPALIPYLLWCLAVYPPLRKQLLLFLVILAEYIHVIEEIERSSMSDPIPIRSHSRLAGGTSSVKVDDVADSLPVEQNATVSEDKPPAPEVLLAREWLSVSSVVSQVEEEVPAHHKESTSLRFKEKKREDEVSPSEVEVVCIAEKHDFRSDGMPIPSKKATHMAFELCRYGDGCLVGVETPADIKNTPPWFRGIDLNSSEMIQLPGGTIAPESFDWKRLADFDIRIQTALKSGSSGPDNQALAEACRSWLPTEKRISQAIAKRDIAMEKNIDRLKHELASTGGELVVVWLGAEHIAYLMEKKVCTRVKETPPKTLQQSREEKNRRKSITDLCESIGAALRKDL